MGQYAAATGYLVQFDKPTLPGSAIWVVVTSPDHDYPTPFVFQVSDTQSNEYKFVGQGNDFNNGIRSGASAGDNYLGIFVVEVVGSDAESYTHGENINADPPSDVNVITSGSIPTSCLYLS